MSSDFDAKKICCRQTGFSFLNLDDRIIQIRVTEGTINLRVLRLEDQESIEVDTPNLAFTVLRPGRYRYRLVVDGKWVTDPHNQYTETNQFGELNNVIEVD